MCVCVCLGVSHCKSYNKYDKSFDILVEVILVEDVSVT